VGTLGLLWLTIALAIRCAAGESTKTTDLRAPRAALAAGMAFLIGTVGGLGTLFAYVVNPQLHAPGRISVFIAFFALFGAALGLDRLRRRFGVDGRGRMAFTAMLAVVLLVGVLSQTSPTMVPGYAAADARYESDGAFVRAIEAQLPGDASIFQLPYVPFPEGADPGRIGEYEDLFDSLHSNRLRWSGGAIEGRPTDWVPAFVKKPLPQILEGVSAVGFSGLYIDREGVSNSASLLSVLRRTLGVAPLTSDNGRFAFFDMAAYNRSFRERYSAAQIAGIAEAALHPQSRG
jgi:phosphoglycerol transferase